MNKKNKKVAEIVLIIAIILFIIMAGITYKNLSILSEGLSQIETTTEMTTKALGE